MTAPERPALVAELANALLEAMGRGITVVLREQSIEILCVECPNPLSLARNAQFPLQDVRKVEKFVLGHRDAWCQRSHDVTEITDQVFADATQSHVSAAPGGRS